MAGRDLGSPDAYVYSQIIMLTKYNLSVATNLNKGIDSDRKFSRIKTV